MAEPDNNPEKELLAICDELWDPNLEGGWEFFVESHGVKIYRLFNAESGLYQYKIYGILEDVAPDVCAEVYMDLNYRKKWDSYVNELRAIEEDGKKGVYWQINFPFMMSNRDYVYQRQYKELDYRGAHIYCVLAESQVFKSEPERKSVIRVTDYLQKVVLTTDSKSGSKAYMHYYDNPGGMIPAWLINWGAKTGVPAFLTDMQKACRGYAKYKASQSS